MKKLTASREGRAIVFVDGELESAAERRLWGRRVGERGGAEYGIEGRRTEAVIWRESWRTESKRTAAERRTSEVERLGIGFCDLRMSSVCFYSLRFSNWNREWWSCGVIYLKIFFFSFKYGVSNTACLIKNAVFLSNYWLSRKILTNSRRAFEIRR